MDFQPPRAYFTARMTQKWQFRRRVNFLSGPKLGFVVLTCENKAFSTMPSMGYDVFGLTLIFVFKNICFKWLPIYKWYFISYIFSWSVTRETKWRRRCTPWPIKHVCTEMQWHLKFLPFVFYLQSKVEVKNLATKLWTCLRDPLSTTMHTEPHPIVIQGVVGCLQLTFSTRRGQKNNAVQLGIKLL